MTAPAERREVVLRVIRDARERLVLSLYRCNDKAVFAELGLARERGVSVDVLVTSRSGGSKRRLRKLWRALEATGVAIHPHADPVVKYHAKYLVADEGPALVASLNFTRKCFAKTIDAIVITHDPEVVRGLRDLIAADCSGGQMPADVSPRLIVGPERARRQFTEIIERAQSSIRLIDRKVSDPRSPRCCISVARPGCASMCTTASDSASCDRTARSCSWTMRLPWSADCR